MQKGLAGRWLRRTWQILVEYFAPSQWYLFLNDSGIYFFTARGRRLNCLVKSEVGEGTYIEQHISDFTLKLKIFNFGQPVTILVGGSFNSFDIELSERARTMHPAKAFPWLDLERVEFKLRIIPIESGKKISYSAAVKKEISSQLLNVLTDIGINVREYLPASYLILSQWLKLGKRENIAVELPGETIFLYFDKSNISIVEKASDDKTTLNEIWWKCLPDGNSSELTKANLKRLYLKNITVKKSKKNNEENVPLFLKPSLFSLYERRGFFGVGATTSLLHRLTQVPNILRVVSLILGSIALILLIFWGSLKPSGGDSESLLADYQRKNLQKKDLLSEIDSLSAILKGRLHGKQASTSFAGAISALCQTKPPGLYLSDVSITREKEGPWQLIAQGISQKERAVMEYREEIVKFTSNSPVEVTLLKRLSNPALNPGEAPKISFGFKVKLRLSADEKI